MKGLVVVLLASASSFVVAPQSMAQDTTLPADNSANNRPDRAANQVTADEQSNSKKDMALTQRVRQSVMEDKTLSVYGKNVKIVSANGAVTLSGVVRTAAEREQIGIRAAAIAGKDRVMNELKVAPAD
ncbi:MAG: BON domain-containing protein [Steroidobacteraceae bacterium]